MLEMYNIYKRTFFSFIFTKKKSYFFFNEADRFFGALKILFYNEMDYRNFWFESKNELVKFFRNKFRALNKNNENNNYKIWCIHISTPPEELKIFKFDGVQSTKWLR